MIFRLFKFVSEFFAIFLYYIIQGCLLLFISSFNIVGLFSTKYNRRVDKQLNKIVVWFNKHIGD